MGMQKKNTKQNHLKLSKKDKETLKICTSNLQTTWANIFLSIIWRFFPLERANSKKNVKQIACWKCTALLRYSVAKAEKIYYKKRTQ